MVKVMSAECKQCGKEFFSDKYRSPSNFKARVYCTRECFYKGNKLGNGKSTRKNRKPNFFIGIKKGAEKGDTYEKIHLWIKSKRRRHTYCNYCGAKDKKLSGEAKSHTIEYANVSGEYKKDLDDWVFLCIPCHRLLDFNRNSISKRFGKINGNIKYTPVENGVQN